MDYGIFYGNILNFLLNKSILKNQGSYNSYLVLVCEYAVGYSLKNQGSNNSLGTDIYTVRLDIHLKIKVVTTAPPLFLSASVRLDIHLKIKAATTYKLELDEFQLYIIKIK